MSEENVESTSDAPESQNNLSVACLRVRDCLVVGDSASGGPLVRIFANRVAAGITVTGPDEGLPAISVSHTAGAGPSVLLYGKNSAGGADLGAGFLPDGRPALQIQTSDNKTLLLPTDALVDALQSVGELTSSSEDIPGPGDAAEPEEPAEEATTESQAETTAEPEAEASTTADDETADD